MRVLPVCKVTDTWAPASQSAYSSPLPNELYKFNHVEGCLVHQFLIRGRGGAHFFPLSHKAYPLVALISSPSLLFTLF